MASGEKTEAPTARRREEARKRGSTPKSAELTSILGLLAGIAIIKSTGASALTPMTDLMVYNFRHLSTPDWTVASASTYIGGLGNLYMGIMTPLFAAVLVVGVAGNYVQSGFMLTGKPLSPDFSRIDPLKGFQRIFSQRSLVELVKSVSKLGIVGYVVFQELQSRYLEVVALTGADIRGAMSVIGDLAIGVLFKAGLALFAVAALDYGYQRWEHERNIRMTKEELREELRQSEGDPKIKAKIRQQQRQLARRRMMNDVPASDVVITNPTHLAIAIQYRPESMRAPKVVAKGQLIIAEKIKEVARRHGVPVVENKPLAQALYKSVEIGFEIPPLLYQAVAEVLAFIYGLKHRRRPGGYGIGS
ncbi:MAG: flagellar biosynthesis protein FlhB [Chloroflexi bacterium]|nr:flagellar biosynthesis protein FlhB [Chloroflexota bacterium]